MRGVRGSGKARAAAARGDEYETDRPHDDGQPRCRVPGCGAVLESGGCPACAFRAKHYKAVMPSLNPNCECGAPKKAPKNPLSLNRAKHCPLCTKLRARMKKQGLLS